MTREVPPVVTAEWVHRNQNDISLIDVRDPWEYEEIGHLPGAVNIPFDSIRGGDDDIGMLPGLDRFETLLSDVGVTRSDRLVAYDDEHGVFAARFLVTALMYGHDQWHLLNGDFSAWNRSFETTTVQNERSPSTYQAVIPDDRPLIDTESVRQAISESEALIIDTRTEQEFREGHLKGAVQLDWRDLVDPDTRGLKSTEELEMILTEIGVHHDRRIILYCNTARRISHTYIVLQHLGYEDVAFYEGSLTDWKRRDYPLVTGI